MTGLIDKNTIIVSMSGNNFEKVFCEKNCWYAIYILSERIPHLKYIAAYRSKPISQITHFAEIMEIKEIRNSNKYIIIFKENSIKMLEKPIGLGDNKRGAIQNTKYTDFNKLFTAEYIKDL